MQLNLLLNPEGIILRASEEFICKHSHLPQAKGTLVPCDSKGTRLAGPWVVAPASQPELAWGHPGAQLAPQNPGWQGMGGEQGAAALWDRAWGSVPLW